MEGLDVLHAPRKTRGAPSPVAARHVLAGFDPLVGEVLERPLVPGYGGRADLLVRERHVGRLAVGEHEVLVVVEQGFQHLVEGIDRRFDVLFESRHDVLHRDGRFSDAGRSDEERRGAGGQSAPKHGIETRYAALEFSLCVASIVIRGDKTRMNDDSAVHNLVVVISFAEFDTAELKHTQTAARYAVVGR